MEGINLEGITWEEFSQHINSKVQELLDDPSKLPTLLDNFLKEVQEAEDIGISKEVAEAVVNNVKDLDLRDECIRYLMDTILPNFCSPEGFKEKTGTIESVSKNAMLLCRASASQRDDVDFVRAAVRQQGISLAFASERLRQDRGIVLDAVNQNGLSLELASNDLRDDKDVVMAALAQNGLSLNYASDRLRDDIDVVRSAIANNDKALAYASDRVREALQA